VPDRDGVRNPINDVAISPDGTRVIVAVGNRVLLYNAETGDLLESLRGHKDTVYCVDFSFDGSKFASGGADKIVVIWKITGQGMLKYNHTASIQSVKYNPVTMQLASCSEVDFGMWTPEQKQVVKEKVHSKILCAAWSSDGSILALGMMNGWVSIRNAQSDELHHIERRAPVWCLEFVPSMGNASGSQKPGAGNSSPSGGGDNDLLVVGCWDKTLSLYRINSTAHRIQGERPLRFYPCALSIANLGGNRTNYMVIGGSNKKVNLYSRDGLRLSELCSRDSWIWGCASHGDSDKVVVGCDSGGISLLQMKFDVVHTLYKDRYAFRENLTEVVVHHLISDRKVRIKCRDYVQRLSLYKNKLAVQLSDKVCIYESNPEETLDMHFRLRRERIQQSANIPCEHMLVTSQSILFCSSNVIQLYSFDGQLQRSWMLESSICYVKMNGGPDGREAVLVSLYNGVTYKVFVDNPFPLELWRSSNPVRCADLSLNRDKLAVVDSEKKLLVIDLKTRDTLFQADGAVSVCFNAEVDEMLCYSGESSMFVVSGISARSDEATDGTQAAGTYKNQSSQEPQEQHLSGIAIGFSGQKIYCLYNNNMLGMDVPQGGNMMKLIEKDDYKAAYHVACLGATEGDWKVLALRSLRANHLDIAKAAFARLKDSKFLHLIEEIERDVGDGAKASKEPQAPAKDSSAGSAPRRGRHAVASNPTPAPTTSITTKSFLDPSWHAEILAYQGHHHEAAKVYARAGRVDAAIRLFTDLRMWNDAKMFAQSLSSSDKAAAFDHSALVQQQAKWLEEINDWKGAAEIYSSMGSYMQAAKIISEAAPETGWQTALIDVVRAAPADQTDVLSFCGEVLSQANEDAMAREAYTKLGDISKLMSLFVKRQMWVEAAKLADDHEGKFDSSVFLPYADWLIMQDRCEDAMQAYKKAGRQDLSRKILEELTFNSVVESRFKDSSYFYWLLAKELSDGTDTRYQLECEHNADLYFAYANINSYVTDPFTSHPPELLFQVSRFIINSLGSSETIPYGISKAATLYTLARQSMLLGAFKLARHTYDRLSKLQIPPRWQEEVERDMLIVQAKPVRDEPEHLPVCYRCSSTNPLLNPFTNKFAKGDVCTNCGHPFVRSFINFDILPLVEFVPEPSISDEEAIELIRTNPASGRNRPVGSPDKSGWNEGKMGDADMMQFGSLDSTEDMMGSSTELRGGIPSEELFPMCLNRTLETQMNAMSYVPVTVDTATLLHGMKRSEVFVCRPSSQNKRATFYKNMLPEIEIAISQSCHRFFHLEDFEFAYLSNKACPFSRLKDVGEYGSL